MSREPFISRLAPSPTGQLHLGNAWSFTLCWLAARASGGKVFLRIDDIDPQRSKPEHIDAILSDLEWLGLDWDEWQGQPIIFQSWRSEGYAAALERLQALGLVYPCFCTRKELRTLASAPHIGDEGVAYPGTCAALSELERQRLSASGQSHALRLRVEESEVGFEDLCQGPQSFSKQAHGGDFPLRRSDGVWSYQLASAIDDGAMGINFVLRGRDLLPSTPRQILIARALGYSLPDYCHIPLLLEGSGERLAKRHASLSLQSLRARGASPRDVGGLFAELLGQKKAGGAMPAQLLRGYALTAVPQADIALTGPLLRAHGLASGQ